LRTIESLPGNGQLDHIEQQLRFLVADAEERRRLGQAYSELIGDLSPVATQGRASLSRALAEAEARGYVDFARSGLGVVDRVVTSFDESDVEALSDNIVLILETLKEMTQPEVMEMLKSTVHQVQEIDEPDQPPSLLALLREMRTVEARRGLYRLVVALQSLGASPPHRQFNQKEVQA
jgi:uncharacterized protein YjgD (DUF1641 family)